MTDTIINSVIRSGLKLGRSKETISAELARAGHTPEEIAQAFADVEHETSLNSAGVADASDTALPHSGERPMIITIICVILSIFFVLSLLRTLLLLLLLLTSPTGLALLIPTIILQLLSFAVIYGYWMMRRWSVYLYATLVVLGYILSITTIITHPETLISLGNLFAILALATGFYYIDDMA